MFQDLEKLDSFELAEDCGANLLEKKGDGSCVYLEGNKCGIHEDRPEACREFFCTTEEDKFQNMVEIIKEADRDKISSVYE